WLAMAGKRRRRTRKRCACGKTATHRLDTWVILAHGVPIPVRFLLCDDCTALERQMYPRPLPGYALTRLYEDSP
ncbi:MAG: hypothetical protein JW726_17305, partial [Anaerolineales bacterium]|nr:hypothetical protein [Anaerolineales bacterium]